MYTVSASGREFRVVCSRGKEQTLVALAVRLKHGEFYQCYPADSRGARFPSQDVWEAAVADALERERKAIGKMLLSARKYAKAAVKTLREMKQRDPHLTHNQKAANLSQVVTIYGNMREDAAPFKWRAERTKKHRQRAVAASASEE